MRGSGRSAPVLNAAPSLDAVRALPIVFLSAIALAATVMF